MNEELFDELTPRTDAAYCTHNHALVHNPFAWEDEDEEAEAE
jgi:hypothetical protein